MDLSYFTNRVLRPVPTPLISPISAKQEQQGEDSVYNNIQQQVIQRIQLELECKDQSCNFGGHEQVQEAKKELA